MDDSSSAKQLQDIIRTYNNYKKLADAAIAQTTDADLHRLIDPDANSVAIVVKHLTGNLRSRFADFLTTDGEKATRNRDEEFEMPDAKSREALLRAWNESWAVVIGELEKLTPADLDRTVYIRKEAFLVSEALNRSVTHLAYHVGQIVMLAKHFQGPNWKSLSIPKGRSAEHMQGSFKQGIVPTPAR
ncbi:MAG TPA: DUF1572 family protein [Vicinamibacterales bacterium]|jgi:hypothetical protein|nr:DUF1572 family protein [Vicinamibacterales bacterium]